MKKALMSLGIFLILSGTALADGFIIPRPEPWLPPKALVDVKYHHVYATINDPTASTRIEQAFVNPHGRAIEADYIFPIPENAAISRFTAYVGDRKMEAELLDADDARRIYEDIVRKRKDPALLEYAGRGIYRLRIFPMPPDKEVRVVIEYDQTLKSDNGTVEYLYPLNTEKYSRKNLETCKVEVEIESFEDVGAVYCASHEIKTERKGDKSARVVYSDEDVKPDQDFLLYFTRQNSDFGFHLLSYKENSRDDGFFLGILSPPLDNDRKEVDKNVIFVLDTSGSMRGEKIEQAKNALKYCLRGLNRGDDFNIIAYSDAVRPYQDDLIRASRNEIEEAVEYVSSMRDNGGTNIYDALDRACRSIPDDGDPTYVIFLTDGLPTVGNTDMESIIKNTTKMNEGRARLFVFGVGYDVNAHLLDRLAQENRGAPEYVLPEEDIEVKVSRMFSKISYPALTDINLKFSGVNIEYVYPEPVPDLFYGSEIIVTGRFDDTGKSSAVVTGKSGDRNVNHKYPVQFSAGNSKDDFIALLWANRRIGYLLQQMRLHGTSDELLDEVVELSKKYGILTEYTSFLVTGNEDMMAEEIMRESPLFLKKLLADNMEVLSAPRSGRSAVTQSKGLGMQQGMTQNKRAGYVMIEGQERDYGERVTQVGAQGFFNSSGNWIQADIADKDVDMRIQRFSEAYFQLIENDPSLGRYLSLGDEVRLKVGNQIIQISEDGKERLSSNELRMLFGS
ncbi:MAG: VWA domain-containing protein [candidate division Zixibacteria bacterium]|nr:VWA domain-containing protein [candidate division Zixibacteria bacterium]